ncbi:S-layer homology domain-containing protein [Paenibacillus sp. J22TS3]|uniref:S-layer homology domain-containing protein n=1 Tax=Paenibacillus sp. J22TS3 TaxID=2807192 RepID=UPI001B10F441|nr:S-layer homology domain-containing protein [Paenibacillus sp. J22TS3]GIP20598.1 hypothetical protein J22TS3_08730 [Paenibacillus sp. J22TS3]
MSIKKGMSALLAFTILASVQPWTPAPSAHAEGASDLAPFITGKQDQAFSGKKILFDNAHANTSGNADPVIDGAFSDFANSLVNLGFYVKELRKSTPITKEDLAGYDVLITASANNPFTSDEQQVITDYVAQDGGAVFFISDNYNSDQNQNRWDPSEVYNGYRRGAWTDPTLGMGAEEKNAVANVGSNDWLSSNFGVRFRYNAIDHAADEATPLTANNIVAPDQSLGVTAGVSKVAIHGGSTLAITDPTKAKGIVYLPPLTDANKWPGAVDQGVYNDGGFFEGAYAAIAKIGKGKAAFLGDMSVAEDSTPKYLREDTGESKSVTDGFHEYDDQTLLSNLVKWLAVQEPATSLDGYIGVGLDPQTQLLSGEEPSSSTEPQAEPTTVPAPGYKWYDTSTYKPGAFGGAAVQQPASSEKAFSAFTWDGNTGTIDEANKTIEVVFPYGTDMTQNKLVTFQVSPGASVLYDGRTAMTSGSSFLPPSVAPASLVVKAEDGSTESYTLKVNISAPAELIMSPASVTLTAGAVQQIKLQMKSGSSTEDTTSQAVWASENNSIATVDHGKVTGVSAGTTKVSATYQGITQKIDVTVNNPVVTTDPGTGSGSGGTSGGGGETSSGGGSSSVPAPPAQTIPTTPSVPSTPSQPGPVVTTPDSSGAGDIFNPVLVKADSNVVDSIKTKVKEAKASAVKATLSDISGHWAEKTIDTFAKLKTVNGYADGAFHPDMQMTRAEFAVILSRVFNITGTGDGKKLNLTDVENHWAKNAIDQLTKAGVLNGYGDGTYKPNKAISREEMVVILSRLVNMEKLPKDQSKGSFTDISSSYAKDKIQSAAQTGVISGVSKTKFDPKSTATRAEALTAILNSLNLNPQIKTLLESLEK